MLMAQRHPTYFDGIISGAPAMRTNFSGIGDEWVATMLNQVAPKNEKGQPATRQALSDADKKAVIDGFLNACDAGDGLEDGMVFNTNACRFDPKTLVCKGAKAEGCLSAEQAAALEKGFAGPKDSKGRQVYPGFLFDTGIAATQGIPGLLHGGLNPVGTRVLGDDDGRRCEGGSRGGGSGGSADGDLEMDEPEHVLEPRRKADVLSWRQRSLVLRARHHRLLRADDEGERRSGRREQLEPAVSVARNGALLRRRGRAGQLRPADAARGLGGEGHAAIRRRRPAARFPAAAVRSAPILQHAHYKGQGDPQRAENFECRKLVEGQRSKGSHRSVKVSGGNLGTRQAASRLLPRSRSLWFVVAVCRDDACRSRRRRRSLRLSRVSIATRWR